MTKVQGYIVSYSKQYAMSYADDAGWRRGKHKATYYDRAGRLVEAISDSALIELAGSRNEIVHFVFPFSGQSLAIARMRGVKIVIDGREESP